MCIIHVLNMQNRYFEMVRSFSMRGVGELYPSRSCGGEHTAANTPQPSQDLSSSWILRDGGKVRGTSPSPPQIYPVATNRFNGYIPPYIPCPPPHQTLLQYKFLSARSSGGPPVNTIRDHGGERVMRAQEEEHAVAKTAISETERQKLEMMVYHPTSNMQLARSRFC